MIPQPFDEDLLLEIGRDAMACRFEVLLHPGQPPQGPEIACKALDIVSYLEQLWSVYLPTSEFSIINARAHEIPVQVSTSTLLLLQKAIQIWKETSGAFDITAAKLTKIWGFHRRQGVMPSEQDIQKSLLEVGSQNVELDESTSTVRFTKRVELNSGGIGKGVAIDEATTILDQAGIENYAIHGGKSSIRCRGAQKVTQPESGWSIAVRHPERSEVMLGTLRLFNQALGTSGPANQFFYFRGKRYGHIIDPRTGWPCDGMLSITILHPQAGWADALATGLFVMGVDNAIAYCQKNPDTSMLAILPGKRDGQVEVITCNMRPDQWIVAPH